MDMIEIPKEKWEAALTLAAEIQDDFEHLTEGVPMIKLANFLLPDRAKQRREDREIYTFLPS